MATDKVLPPSHPDSLTLDERKLVQSALVLKQASTLRAQRAAEIPAVQNAYAEEVARIDSLIGKFR